MTTMHEKLGVGTPGMTSIDLETITTTEETRAIHLLHGLGQGSDIPIVVAMTTLTEIETLTKTEETKGTTGTTETPETILENLENLTTEGISESLHWTPSQSPTNAPRLPPNDTQKTLTSTPPQAQEQTATKTAMKTLTTQENQIVKSYSGA